MPRELKRLQAELLAMLAEMLAREGFRLAGQAFHKKTPDGRHTFHIAFIEHEADFDVTADVAIRFDAVEQLVNRDNKLLSAREKKETATLGTELGNLSEGRQRRWTVRSADDLPQVVTALYDAFKNVAVPYFSQFGEPTLALIALGSNTQAGWIHAPVHSARCVRAAALATVLGRSDELSRLVNECERFLAEIKDPGLAKFRSFVATLSQ